MSFQIEGPGEYLTREGTLVEIVGETHCWGGVYWRGRISGVKYIEGQYSVWDQAAGGKVFCNWATDNDIVSKVAKPTGMELRERYFAEL